MMINTGYRVPQQPDTLITHRIIEDHKSRLWLFFQSHYRSLAFGVSEDRGKTWSPPRELLPDISGPFTAAAGPDGSVYVAARRNHPPDIYLLAWNGRDWSEGVILEAAGKNIVTSSPLVTVDNSSRVHVVFAIRGHSSAEWEVKHYLLDLGVGKISERIVPPISSLIPKFPARLDFLKEAVYWSGDIAVDAGNNLHLACRSFSGSHYQIFHSIFGAAGEWNSFSSLTDTPFHRGQPRLIPGLEGNGLHILFSLEKEGENSLACISRNPGGKWGEERILAEGLPEDFPPEPVKTPSGLALYWADGTGINRTYLDMNYPAEKMVGEMVSSFSAAFSRDRVFLACTGLDQDQTAIFLAEDQL